MQVEWLAESHSALTRIKIQIWDLEIETEASHDSVKQWTKVQKPPWDARAVAQPEGKPAVLQGPTIYQNSHSVSAGVRDGVSSLTPAGNQLSPWSIRFNYPYLSLNNCKCYCWSHRIILPFENTRPFPWLCDFLSQGNNVVNVPEALR